MFGTYEPAPTLADAHSQWHAIHGTYELCPLDCGATSPEQALSDELCNVIAYEDSIGTASIRCGHCPDTHRALAAVRACAALAAMAVTA